MLSESLDAIRRAKHWAWMYGYRRKSARTIDRYVRDNPGRIRVNIGCSESQLAGWLNGDIWKIPGAVYMDALKRLPFADGSVRCINAEHFIEHLSASDGQRFLREAHRALAPDGVLRLTTPDLDRLMRMYRGEQQPTGEALLEHHRKFHGRSVPDLCTWFNDHMHEWGHQFLYDRAALDRALAQAGFSNRRECGFGESRDPDLVGVEKHDEGVAWMRTAYLLIVEARKS